VRVPEPRGTVGGEVGCQDAVRRAQTPLVLARRARLPWSRRGWRR
jgi:hypothetical protein